METEREGGMERESKWGRERERERERERKKKGGREAVSRELDLYVCKY